VEYALSEEGRELNKLVLGLSIRDQQWLERRGLNTAVEEDLDELKKVLGALSKPGLRAFKTFSGRWPGNFHGGIIGISIPHKIFM
jgi:hypothetical protein